MVELSMAVSVVGGIIALMIGLLCWIAQRLIAALDSLSNDVRSLENRLTRIEVRLEDEP